ncbi:MAG: hypothetical protein JOZ19_10535 [Rubrobacter sp.]|nr:hypothetical protein [Rubrobacter sp.]
MRRDGDQASSQTPLERLTVADAALLMGVSQDAVRKRIQRNTIRWDKDAEGRVYVYLDASETRQATDQDASKTPLEIMQDQVEYLRRQLEVWQEEARRKDHIIAALTERIPELEPAREPTPEPRERREAATEEPSRGTDTPDETDEPRSPWWRRMFRG